MRWPLFLACAVRLYTTLLVLCPPRFRADYGADMTALFQARCERARRQTAVQRWSSAALPAWPISLRPGSRAAWRACAGRAAPFPVTPVPEVIPCSPKP